MGPALGELIECDFRPRHVAVEEQVKGLRRDVDDLREMRDQLVSVVDRLGKLEGRIAGYLVAATVLSTVVAFIAQHALK